MPIRLNFKPRRILVIYWGPYGDVLITLPLIESLAQGFGARVTYVLGDPSDRSDDHAVNLLQHHPRIEACWPGSLNVVRNLLCDKPFDLVIDLCGNTAGRLFSRYSGAKLKIWGKFRGVPRRIFWSRRQKDGSWGRVSSWAFTKTIPRARQFLQIARLLGIQGEQAGAPFLYLTSEEKKDSLRVSKRLKEGKEFLVVLHPGGCKSFRLWPAKHYAALIRRLEGTGNIRAVVTRGPLEEKKSRCVVRNSGLPVPIVYKSRIREYLKVLAGCDCFVTTDSGPLHIALALGTPCVGIFRKLGVARYWYNGKQRGTLERIYFSRRRQKSGSAQVEDVFQGAMKLINHEKSRV